jgi:hypothetical protein
MPCPAGVDIPECFALYNSANLFPQNRQLGMVYLGRFGGIIGNKAYAGLCIQCGKCEKICPQHIPIPARLKEVSKSMEGVGFGIKIRVGKVLFRLMDGISQFRTRKT